MLSAVVVLSCAVSSWGFVMQRRFRSVLQSIAVLACCAASVDVTSVGATSGDVTRADAASVDDLAWLSGCWRIEGAEAGSIESWLSPAGATLFGVSRTVKGGKTVAHEFMQIRALDDGTLAYIAKPSNQAEATFPLARIGKDEVMFENKTHDFPQRIHYRLTGPDALMARIEGTRAGTERSIEYPMKKIDCP
jgi:hypothetical protein